MFRNDAGATVPPASPGSSSEPQVESLRLIAIGSRAALQQTVKTLHKKGYAEATSWSKPQPTEQANEWVIVLSRRLRIG
ncbi:MAG: hypothetical protein F6J97_04020 [Leptolyngbya sp. SIO4C1]|nr:hypothetical protein [Leptolyngbya sp. SIO4C1]